MTGQEMNELIVRLRDEDNCDVLDDIDDAADALESLVAQLAALQTENGEKDREIEKLRMQVRVKDACISGKSSIINHMETERDAAQKCIYDVETYLELGSGVYIAKTIQAWKNGVQGEG